MEKRTKKWKELRNGEVSFTESQFRKLTGYCKGTHINARNKLIETGFIINTHSGGGGSGDTQESPSEGGLGLSGASPMSVGEGIIDHP